MRIENKQNEKRLTYANDLQVARYGSEEHRNSKSSSIV
ncbi:hypothetical protein FBBNIHIM_19405 [Pseudocitrobacter vendiensis]|uniref:Uncharacterized protein n=1 Tax=Pseudocitrobacter vendiensis TaxID=2488306 RepID=A0ABN8TIM8_9ENTR|nr:hypothetical protein FBBNIHIM_19405 [Pseudocitrobacter vendiensis]